MGDRFDWRWLLRARCRAIASTYRFTDPDGYGGTRVHLCDRWRFHSGSCEAAPADPPWPRFRLWGRNR